MRILSATEAVSPAIARTKLVLFKPFRFGRSWKFAATGYVSTMGSFFFPFPLLGLFMVPAVFHEGPKWLIWAVVPGIALLLVLMTFIFALCSRLQFPFMDVVMNRSVFIAPLWRQYGPPAHRWVRAKILIGTITSLVLAIPCGIFFWMGIHGSGSHPTTTHPQQLPVPTDGAFFGFFATIIFIYGALILITLAMSLLNDFMLPPLALEDATISGAWQFVRNLVSAEPGQVALYALLKVVLGFIAQMACGIIMEIVLVVVVLILLLVGALIGMLLHAAHAPDVFLQVLGIFALAVVYIGFIGYAAPFANGITMVFLEAYKLYFIGGRYPPLGDLLDRSTPLPEPNIPNANYLAYAAPPAASESPTSVPPTYLL